MNDIAKNLKFCFDISKFKSMSQFCKVIDINQANKKGGYEPPFLAIYPIE